MAFVEVIRRSMRPEEWTDLRFGWLKRGISKPLLEITDLKIRDARQVSEDSYEYYPEGWRDLRRGDMYFTPDGTAFIQGHVTIPHELLSKELWFTLHTASEMIVKVNGKFAGGVDPNRDRFLISPYIGDDGEVDISIEAYNRSKPDDERNPETLAVRGCRQIFEGAFISEVNHAVLNLYYDLIGLIDITKSPHFDEDAREYIKNELNAALNLVDFDTFCGCEEASAYLERRVFQNKDFRGNGTVALVGHSHLDIAYYWRRIHAVQKNARTVLIQLRLMDQYPDFHYTHTQPYLYSTLEKYYPELFQELKEKIRSGQFEPVGAMFVEPDCNIPTAESLVRQCLYGQHYYRRAFGITVDTCWLPDVFGNSWILPQILKKSGVDYFISNKMSTWNDTNRFPHNNFLWKGIDGTRIYACVPPTHFITWNMPSQVMENWDAYEDKEKGGATLSMFGYGDGGSGVTEEMIEVMHRFDKMSVMPHTEHMRADKFLHSNFDGNTDLETWDGELYLEMHRGTFTTKHDLKAANRRLEKKLRTAEIVSSLRRLQGEEYPMGKITEAYKKLLLNQFHDILPGSHIRPVFEDAMNDYKECERLLDEVLDEKGPELFNPMSLERTEPFFVEKEDGFWTRHGKKGFYSTQRVPALSSALVEDLSSGDISWFSFDGMSLSTPFYDAVLNEDGSFSSLKEKDGREWVKGGFNKLHLYQDTPGMYDAWDILPNYNEVEFPLEISVPLRFSKADSTALELETVLSTGKSSWKLLIRFFRSSREIEVEHICSWHEKHRLMKLEFAPEVLSRTVRCDTSAGFIDREATRNTSWQKARFECCTHLWTDISESDGGVALLNEGKYGIGLQENGFTLSLMRANIRPDILSDIGDHDFITVILPHRGSSLEAEVNRKALELNTPLVRAGLKAPSWDFGPLYLQALKVSEDGKKLVFRLSEQDGRRGRIALDAEYMTMNLLEDVTGKTSVLEYKPFEIITIAKEL